MSSPFYELFKSNNTRNSNQIEVFLYLIFKDKHIKP